MSKKAGRRGDVQRERGVVLFTTLIMLMAVMALGFTASQLWKSELLLTGNLQFQEAAFQSAEAAVTEAEAWLAQGSNSLDPGFGSRSTGGLYPVPATNTVLLPDDIDWTDAGSLAPVGIEGSRYVIIKVADSKRLPTASSLNTGGRNTTACNLVNIYRIIGRGENARGALRFVQTLYAVPACV